MQANRLDVLWPFLVIAAAALWILRLVGTVPPIVVDMIGRAWPAALIALGLILLLGRRMRLGNLIAVGLSALLVVGLSSAAYGRQTVKTIAEGTTQRVNQAVAADVKSIKIKIDFLLTEIVLQPNPTGQRVIDGSFLGSASSKLVPSYQVDGDVATFTLQEIQDAAFVPLEAIGIGKMTLSLPVGVNIDELTVTGREGDLTLDATSTGIKTLTLATEGGNLSVKLPQTIGLIADLKTGRGGVTLEVPPAISAQITLRGGAANNPEFSSSEYILTRDNVLVPQRAPHDPQMQITVEATERASVK